MLTLHIQTGSTTFTAVVPNRDHLILMMSILESAPTARKYMVFQGDQQIRDMEKVLNMDSSGLKKFHAAPRFHLGPAYNPDVLEVKAARKPRFENVR